MANDPIQPYTGPDLINLAALIAFLVDLSPGALRGLRREQPGIAAVLSELAASVPVLGAKAAISADVYASLVTTHERILKIREARLIVDKVAEVLAESEVYYEDQREGDITLIATAVRTTARRKDESIRAAFEKTLTYNAQAAKKAAKTRRKNAAEAEAEATAEAEAEADDEAEAEAEDQGGAPEEAAVEPGGAPSVRMTP